ncbi:MAG: indolepyruvate ferredoxin oxidoreductase [Proteobacteria bacterium]|nr:indolepyruvate ferredoxin oxidoreductase [Pseudomonadota bacterium]
MANLIDKQKGTRHLLMGNEAIARGALEAGMSVAAGYPGTPSSEIIESLARVSKDSNLYVEWSANEKVAMEVAAAASFAELRSICVLKQNGLHVASDFLLHLAGSGTRGGMLVIPCDDPGALSSINEGDTRHFARMIEIPLLEPGDFQEVKDMTRWGFELSEELNSVVMLRSVTRLSHASGNVVFGELPPDKPLARFKYDGPNLDPKEGVVSSSPVSYKHAEQHKKLRKAVKIFENSPFNTYTGPDNPELLVVTSSACNLYSREAIHLLGVGDRVGILKIGTSWPLPPKLVEKHLRLTDKILVVEEVIPFLEENIKILAFELAAKIGIKTVFGKRDGSIPMVGELNPDFVVAALTGILEIDYESVPTTYEEKARKIAERAVPTRDPAYCAGCPHRASYWSINNVLGMDNRRGFVCGDIGCYTMDRRPSGFRTIKTVHSMGSGTGLASGFGKLGKFGLDQPVLSVCGDSTFFHAVMPALVNAVHHRSDITVVVLDNSGTAMTGFQPHPGLEEDAEGSEAVKIDIQEICRSIGAEVKISDPFDLEGTQQTLCELLERKQGVRVLILKQACALSPARKGRKYFEVSINAEECRGENCGCNRVCTRIFKCPGLIWDRENKITRIDEAICVGCGVCVLLCPTGAIKSAKVVSSVPPFA